MTRWQPRIVPPLYFLGSILVMVALHRAVPAGRLSGPVRLIGSLPLLVGLAFNLWGAMLFRINETPLRPGSESTVVVRTGACRFSRNPMYLGFVLELLGVALLLGSASPLVVPPLFMVLIQILFIRNEEKSMEERFGEQYLAYKRRMRRWI